MNAHYEAAYAQADLPAYNAALLDSDLPREFGIE